MIKQKGMTFDHDFGYSLSLLSSLLKREEEKENKQKKMVIKSHAFLLDLFVHVLRKSGNILSNYSWPKYFIYINHINWNVIYLEINLKCSIHIISVICYLELIEQKGITFDHNFGYSFPFFSSLEVRRKGNWIVKIVIKIMPFRSIPRISDKIRLIGPVKSVYCKVKGLMTINYQQGRKRP